MYVYIAFKPLHNFTDIVHNNDMRYHCVYDN